MPFKEFRDAFNLCVISNNNNSILLCTIILIVKDYTTDHSSFTFSISYRHKSKNNIKSQLVYVKSLNYTYSAINNNKFYYKKFDRVY